MGGRPFDSPFDRLRTGFDRLRANGQIQGQARLRTGPFDGAQDRGLGVVDGGWGAEAEDAVFVEVESVSEDPQVPHATGES